MLKRLIVGVFLIWIWVGLVYYNRQLVKMFGRNMWFEDKFGSTESMYVLGGIFLMIVGFRYIFNWN